LRNIFKISGQSKKILIGISIIVSVSFLAAYLYYNSKNRAEDPRIVQTKYMLKRYDELMKEDKFSEALPLLDSVENIFERVPGYKESYEPGIVYNNRGSAYLSMALYGAKDSTEKFLLLNKARRNIDSALVIYDTWLVKYKGLTKEEITLDIKPFFSETSAAFEGKNFRRIFNKRVDDLILARNETPRRLSVCYTNLGIVQRHLYKQNEAVESYIKAIKLWKDNFTARNNFNVLMGKEPKDRSIINKLFPPDKNKFN
jgi:tetratricopeptide (TPR) repeat protein